MRSDGGQQEDFSLFSGSIYNWLDYNYYSFFFIFFLTLWSLYYVHLLYKLMIIKYFGPCFHTYTYTYYIKQNFFFLFWYLKTLKQNIALIFSLFVGCENTRCWMQLAATTRLYLQLVRKWMVCRRKKNVVNTYKTNKIKKGLLRRKLKKMKQPNKYLTNKL